MTWFPELYDVLLKCKYSSIEEYPLFKELKHINSEKTKEAAEKKAEAEGEKQEVQDAKPEEDAAKDVKPEGETKEPDTANKPDDETKIDNGQASAEPVKVENDKESEAEGAVATDKRPLLVTEAKNPAWKRDYRNLVDTDRESMFVDEIFALYLYRTSSRINETFYKTVLAYVIFFRECLNEIGWQKRIESE